jgi:uncharacterized membrane protein
MPIFGSRIVQAIRTLRANVPEDNAPEVDRLYRKSLGKPAKSRNRSDVATLVAQMVFSLLVLTAALYVILSRQYEADTQKWAFGMIGLIVGYWLG